MRSKMLVLVGIALALVVVGCSLVTDLDTLRARDAGNADDARGDVSFDDDAGLSDASIDVGPACEAGTCGAPEGFQPVFFAMGIAFPQCDANQFDVLVDPGSAPANSCACTCKFTSPGCLPQPLVYYDDVSCSTKETSSTVLDGGCDPVSGVGGSGPIAIHPFPLAAGSSCTSGGAVATGGLVPSTPGRICGTADCGACTAPQGFQLCFFAQGSVACPAPLKPHVVATSADVACAPCTACTMTGSCGGTVTLYHDSQCTQSSQSVPVTSACTSTGMVPLASVRYAPVALVDAGCVPGTSAASVQLTAEGTICCP